MRGVFYEQATNQDLTLVNDSLGEIFYDGYICSIGQLVLKLIKRGWTHWRVWIMVVCSIENSRLSAVNERSPADLVKLDSVSWGTFKN